MKRPTPIADYNAPNVQALIEERGWLALAPHARIGAAYTFVKDEIAFGYNARDDLSASAVLKAGYGQCNTKGNLLFALLRAMDIPVRVRGLTIDKELQRGAIPNWLQRFAPPEILHSWIEAQLDGSWLELEGFILDAAYLQAVQERHPSARAFRGYGVATNCLANPEVEWRGRSTYIQREGVVGDFGTFETPDEFYAARGTNLRGLRKVLYGLVLRHIMNRNVARIRKGAVDASLVQSA